MENVTSHPGRPRDLLFTLFGEFLLDPPGPVRVGSLIALLEPLGVSATNTRTVLSRMAAKGWLESGRMGRRGHYALTARGRRLLEEGKARIYRPRQDVAWDGEWTLLAYSIPEEQRSQRDRLRVRLSWLGFGSLGNGLWITPHDVVERVAEIAAELDVTGRLEVFRARHAGFGGAASLVGQAWDLAALNAEYDAFVGRHLAACVALRDGGPDSIEPEEAYVRRFGLVHEYRAFPLRDPFLPRALQPEAWAGECALALFQFYHDLLEEPADRFVESIVETPEDAAIPAH